MTLTLHMCHVLGEFITSLSCLKPSAKSWFPGEVWRVELVFVEKTHPTTFYTAFPLQTSYVRIPVSKKRTPPLLTLCFPFQTSHVRIPVSKKRTPPLFTMRFRLW